MARARLPRFAATLLVILSATVFLAWTGWTTSSVDAAAKIPQQQPTPVGSADAVCATCHRSIFESYLKTPMANASGVATDGLIPGTFVHAQSGTSYQVSLESDGPVLSYQQASQGISGQKQLLYYLGSGNLGRTYLYNIDEYLLESPVAYHSSLSGYAMAPGLGELTTMPGSLPMNALCMRCHMSDVQKPLSGSGNRFAGLPFLHGGITCEQCHGDTTQHVQSRGKQSVVNPAKLDARARDSVCISCHLEGDTSVELREKSVFDYKPGQDIRAYLSYFVEPGESDRSVTETEQLGQSTCKKKSGDRMSCVSCHDPHSRPDEDHRVAFFRSKCLACHTGTTFAATHHPENQDCTSCHMPRSNVRDTPHVAWTDHRILRVRNDKLMTQSNAHAGELVPALPGETVSSREVGLASYNLLLKGEMRRAATALSELQSARSKDPSDDLVEVTLASLYQRQGRSEDALRLYEDALTNHPGDVAATNDYALLLARQGKITRARDMWRQVFAEAKDQEIIGINLSIMECMQGETARARSVLETVLRFNPASAKAREQQRLLAERGCSSE